MDSRANRRLVNDLRKLGSVAVAKDTMMNVHEQHGKINADKGIEAVTCGFSFGIPEGSSISQLNDK